MKSRACSRMMHDWILTKILNSTNIQSFFFCLVQSIGESKNIYFICFFTQFTKVLNWKRLIFIIHISCMHVYALFFVFHCLQNVTHHQITSSFHLFLKYCRCQVLVNFNLISIVVLVYMYLFINIQQFYHINAQKLIEIFSCLFFCQKKHNGFYISLNIDHFGF